MSQLEKDRALGRAHVLDVRGAAEFEAGHVPGALHVPHTRIPVNVDMLPTDKPLLVSATAAPGQRRPSRCCNALASPRST